MTKKARSGGDRYDLVIIGMGSGGTVAAEFAARRLGLRVAAVERARVGGDCLWTGCVPSKALVASARAAHRMATSGDVAVDAAPAEIDPARIWRRIGEVQARIATTDDDPERFRSMGVDLIEGEGVVTGPHEVNVGGRSLTTRYVLVCTGGRPAVPAIAGIDEIEVLTSENVFTLDRPPGSLVVVGGGPVACELSQALNRIGVDVTMIEMADRLLARDEPRHADRLLDLLRAEGVDVRLGRTVQRIERGGDGVRVELDTGEHVTAERLLAATGRVAATASLGLEQLGIECSAAGVTVDRRSRTSVSSIYVVGDANARPNFTHTAAYDAGFAVRDMFFPGRARPADVVPWCTFTDPEVAHVGLTEAEAIDRHGAKRVDVHRHDLADSDRARTDATTGGEIAIVTARGGRIVGAHAICPHAGELIHELTLAIHAGLTMVDLSRVIHVYPTLSTGIGRLALEAAAEKGRRYRFLARIGRLVR